jgi:undecaprenyl-diphosphatase
LGTFLFIDTQLFHFLNSTIANPFFDIIMPFITNVNNWRIPIAIFWIFLVVKGGRRGRVAAILIIPVLVFSDQITAFVIKPWVGRIRPCYALEHVRLLVGCGGKYSFPSNHATNISGFAMLFTFLYSRYKIYLWSLAGLIGFSRVYVGKHYPLDVVCGTLLGILIAVLVWYLYKLLASRIPSIQINPAAENRIKEGGR